jgi:thioesterase domain-containing protein
MPTTQTSITRDALQRLEQMITDEMPITQHLEFSLARNEDGSLMATAPLKPNANHMGSAFGGSISMLATLTGWAMAQSLVEDMRRKAEVLIQESDIEYLKPVRDNLSVVCERPDEDALERFQQMLERWGKARLRLKCRIEEAGERAVTFIGQYVALSADKASDR